MLLTQIRRQDICSTSTSSHILPSLSSSSTSSSAAATLPTLHLTCTPSKAEQLTTVQPTSQQQFQRKCTYASLALTSKRPLEPAMPNRKKAKGSNRYSTFDPLEEAASQLSSSIQSSLQQPKQRLEHQAYGTYVAERMATIKSKRTLIQVRKQIDTILDDAILAELSD